MDLTASCVRFPKPGETVFGDTFATVPGGKGANQAVACARLGREVWLLAKFGRDAFRDELTASLRADGVRLDHVLEDPEAPTGVALITVDRTGENQILVVSGSNMRFMPEEIEARSGVFTRAAVVLLQLEIPVDTVRRAAVLARTYGARVILNPAPARPLPDTLLRHVDVLTPNETEAERLSGEAVVDHVSAVRAAETLLERGVGCVIVTLGAAGCVRVDASGSRAFPAPAVRAVDTTAAGDAFNGALAGGLARGLTLDEATALAVHASAFSVTRPGAQPSMPTPADLVAFP